MSEVIELTDATFDEVLQANEYVLVDFGAKWCHPCKQVGLIVEELAEEWDGFVKVCKLDTAMNIDSAILYMVMTIPTLILFKKGIQIKRMSGPMSKERILEKFSIKAE